MKYSWGYITESINFGNQLIEYSILKLFEDQKIGKPHFEFDTFGKKDSDYSQIAKKINSTDMLIIPGCTTLTTHEYPALKNILPKINVPVYNIGATFAGKDFEPDLSDLKYFEQPIATRDPYSATYLKNNGIDQVFVGCPTLLLSNKKEFTRTNNKRVFLALGYKKIEEQISLIKKIKSEGYSVWTMIQEENQRKKIEDLHIETYEYNPKKLLSLLPETSLCISARLHGALPSLSLGIPVFFIETMEDFRFSILEYIGINFHKTEDNLLNLFVNFIGFPYKNEREIYKNIDKLRDNFIDYVKSIKNREGNG